MGYIYPGRVWLDTEGNRIHAHGGSILCVGSTFYWYGENKEKTLPHSGIWHNGVNLYSSSDLCAWKREGTIVFPSAKESDPLHPTRIMDRPHILYNDRTKKYVLWVKFAGTKQDKSDWSCQFMGVAQADTIHGPFEMAKYIHPLGMNSGDFDLVKDENTGKAYIYFERVHSELICADLTDDYMDVTGNYTRHFNYQAPPFVREAPCFFMRKGKKYLLTSGTTGYFPNPSEVAVADEYHGPWEVLGDPCVGDTDKNSFCSQFSSVFKHPFKKDLYIALGDRWLTDLPADMPNFWDAVTGKVPVDYDFNAHTEQNTAKADYVWLPIQFDGQGKPTLKFTEQWSPDDYE